MLDKRLKLGGLQVGGPRTMQNVARFRVANNVYQTRDDVLIPRFHNEIDFSIPGADDSQIECLAQYKGLPFAACRASVNGGYTFYYDGVQVPYSSNYFGGPGPINICANGIAPQVGIQCVEKLGCLFIHFPIYGLFKFDGVQVYKAGVPLPYVYSAQNDSNGLTYVRVIQHHIDFQGNVVHSGYVQFRATPSASNITIRHDRAATDLVGSLEVEPNRRTSELNGTYNEHYFIASTATVDNGDREITVTGDFAAAVGSYVIVSAAKTAGSVSGLTSDSTYAVALKVKDNSASLVLDMNDAKWLDAAGDWRTGNLSAAPTIVVVGTRGSNYWLSVWTSDEATGNYAYKTIFPAMYNAPASAFTEDTFNASAPTTPSTGSGDVAFNLAPNLGGIYDVTTVKDVFPPAGAASTGFDYPLSFTTYGELALVSYNNEVFHSDSSLGGAFEMVNGLSFIVVGNGDDGIIQNVCGNGDFLLVSRQFQNYYVSGNLPTANYRQQKITNTSVGAYSNESAIAYEDKIIFANKQGIWALYAGGRCEEVSQFIRGLFTDWSSTTASDEQAYFDISNFPTYANFQDPNPVNVNYWMRVRRDVSRGLIVFLTGDDDSGLALVLNMNNGEFYTWNNLSTVGDVKDLIFIEGTYYVGVNDGSTGYIYSELKSGVNKYAYGPSRLEGTWFVAGEPSLEKKLNQLKMWGLITSDVDVSHYLDWDGSTEVDDGTYSNSSGSLYSHKRRLKPANFQAVSVAMEIDNSGTFELEGLEIEFQPLQEGMKR